MRRCPLLLPLSLALLSGCSDSGRRDRPTGPEWQPDAARLAQLEPEREILWGKASIRPPKGYELQQLALGDPAAVFVDEPNRIEILQLNGLSEKQTRETFAKKTRSSHERVSDLEDLDVGEVEHGAVNGVAFSRFQYTGQNDEGSKIRGIYLIARPVSTGPVWNVVAEGTVEEFPALEASVLTFRPID